MEKILVIEDDPTVQKALKCLFESAGYAVNSKTDGIAGLESFRSITPSAVVLDLGLPGRRGQEICRDIKEQSPSLPVVVLSAITDVTDKVLLIEMGADDYVTKPFSPRELLARVQCAIRRSNRTVTTDFFAFGNVAVDFPKMEVSVDKRPVPLTAQEFKLFKFLVKNQERVISREELLNEVWGYEQYPTSRTVDNHVLRLRQKLEKNPTEPMHFKTVHAVGYKFVP